jgi:hypothetical protein
MIFDPNLNRHWKTALTSIALIVVGLLTWLPRMEMYNPFNRIVLPNIGVGNPINSPTRNSNGLLTGGFGFMNVNNIAAGTARNMLVVARIAS